MAKTTVIVEGVGLGAKLGDSKTISDIVSIAFPVFGDRDEIDLTTIDATKYKQKLLSDIEKLGDITITKKADPVNDSALYSTSIEPLVISYKIGGATAKNITFYVQLKDISASTVERAPGDGVNCDLVFFICNLDADLAEQGPEITSPA